jgi:hypothetical protein
MNYRDSINAIVPFKKEQYAHIKSDSRLGACTAYILTQKGIPLTMNYLGIAMFKMFPDNFYCDEDFKEYPSLDRLNREICMHMTITKKKSEAFLAGSAKKGFQLTKYGEFVGRETKISIEKSITNLDQNYQVNQLDKHKNGKSKEYFKLTSSNYFKEYKLLGNLSKNFVWKLFDVIPFTKVSSIKKQLKLAEVKARELNDDTAVSFINEIYKQLS